MEQPSKQQPSKQLRRVLLGVLVGLSAVSFLSCSKQPSPDAFKTVAKDGVFFLGQGWDMDTRQRISYTSFGSRMLDYQWFLHLEQADNSNLLRDNAHMTRLGFISQPASTYNPDALPVGVVRDTNAQGASWIGFTCAACHTGQVEINGTPVRIDGGQSLINFSQFETAILSSLKATLADSDKWQRFIHGLQQSGVTTSELSIKASMQQRVGELEKRFAINYSATAYGHGRLDAFGQIFNAIAVDALHLPENAHSPDAPTSFPVLWDASHLNVVQWNFSAPNSEPGPLFQNATTALAVYGTVDVQGHSNTYPSSIQIKNEGDIQRAFYDLIAPKWPRQLAGELHNDLIKQGHEIYQQECVQCHHLVDSSNPTRQVEAIAVPLDIVKTDARMVHNFSSARVKTGILEGKHSMLFFGDKLGAEASSLDVVTHVSAGALAHHPWDSLCAIVTEFARRHPAPSSDNQLYYKARPINGIWASAPYLHNGSVPTVYDLLLPSAERPVQFHVGNRELDLQKIGNKTSASDASSLFDTRLLGNSNMGHEYGTQLNESDRFALLEYIKSL